MSKQEADSPAADVLNSDEEQYVTRNEGVLSVDEQKKIINDLARDHGINQRKLMAKLDMWIVPPICLLYLLAFIDRVNISNAKVYGMAEDLNLTGTQYNTALTIFFVPYVVCEIPSNYLLKKFRPSVWLPACMVLFGAVMIGQGFVKNYGGLVATRFLLGLFEAGMFPGCFYLLAMWYRRDEAQKRYSFFFSSTCLAGAFGGLIAYGCSQIDGDLGIEGWRWIYIIEGAITVFCALLMFFAIADFPEEARFLNENERQFLKAKLELDVGTSNHENKITLRGVFKVLADYKVILAGLMYFGLIVPAYSYSYFSPSIIQSFNYSPVQTQLHSIPPWAASFGFSMMLAVVADKTRHRFTLAIFTTLVCIGGYIILMATDVDFVNGRYAACFLIACGAYTAMPLIVCWTSMNFAGHIRKSVATGFQIGFGNIGGIIATYVFLEKDFPEYMLGLSVGIGFSIFTLLVTIVYFLSVLRENKLKERGVIQQKWESMSPQEQAEAGDLDPKFRYSY
jgi:MFS family permease